MELNEQLFKLSGIPEVCILRKVTDGSRQHVHFANFFQDKKGVFKLLYTGRSSACHFSFLRRVEGQPPTHGLTFVDHTTKTLDPHHNLYFDWLLNESTFADNFLTKNSDSAKAFGIVIKQNEECLGHPFAAVIATRMLQEHVRNGELWVALVKAGVDKNLAYVIATSWQGETGKMFLDSISHGGCTFYRCKGEDVKRFLQNKPDKDVGRCAEALFADNRSKKDVFLDKWRPEYTSVATSRWGNEFKSVKQDTLVAYYAEHWREMFADLGLPVDGKPVVKKKKPKSVVINTDEPETDL